MKRFVPVVLFSAPIALAVACYGATQMTVEVQTDLRCAEQLRTALYVGEAGEAIGETAESECTQLAAGASTLGDLVLVPGGDREQSVSFKVKLGVGVDAQGNRVDAKRCEPGAAGCVVASRRFTYAAHEQRRIVVRVYRDCLGKVCGDGLTCVQGGSCVSDEVRCQGADCGVAEERPFVAPVDAGPEADAPAPDAGGSDAGPARCTGPNGDGVLVASSQMLESAASDGAIFWVEIGVPTDTLRRLDKASGVISTVSGVAGVTAFALEGETAWYTAAAQTGSSLLFVPSAGGLYEQQTLFGLASPEAMTFVPSEEAVFIGHAGGITKVSRAGQVQPFSTQFSGIAFAHNLGRLLAIDLGDSLRTFPLSNPSGVTPITTGATAVVADASGAFVSVIAQNSNPPRIYAVPSVGPSLYADRGSEVSALALDSARLYWVEGSAIWAGSRSSAAAAAATGIVSAGKIVALSVDAALDGCIYYWSEIPGTAPRAHVLRVSRK